MKRAKHSLSNYKLFSCDMGELIPCGLTEVLPGDTVQQATTALVRCSPLLAPVMHPVSAKIHHWFVPHRLVWDGWEDFITGGPDGNNVDEFPVINTPAGTGAAVGSLSDYLGVPTGVPDLEHSALPYRGYALIWNNWYRDQDLQAELPISTESGVDTTTSTALQNAAWEKDYYTSARPWEQKGPAVTVPIGEEAPVRGFGKVDQAYNSGGQTVYETDGTGSVTYQGYRGVLGDTPSNTFHVEEDPNNPGFPNIRADLSNASGVTVNQLRKALAIQRYQEARARYGSRYVEYLRYLNVKSSDARLQRPEYLGGGQQTIQFSEVLSTYTNSADGIPQGNMTGHGIAAMKSNRYRRFFEEHGYVFSFIVVKPKTMYSQSLARHWSRKLKEDFWQKELEHIGQQEILNKEVYAGHSNPNGIFGYQDRYDEYRRTESTVSGEFRETLLNFWHLARDFGADVALNGDFVTCTPTERIFAVPSQDTLYIMAKHSIQARRLVAQTGQSYIY